MGSNKVLKLNWLPQLTPPGRGWDLNASLLVSNPLLFPLHVAHAGQTASLNTGPHGVGSPAVSCSFFHLLCYPFLRFQSRMWIHLADCSTVRHDVPKVVPRVQETAGETILRKRPLWKAFPADAELLDSTHSILVLQTSLKGAESERSQGRWECLLQNQASPSHMNSKYTHSQ